MSYTVRSNSNVRLKPWQWALLIAGVVGLLVLTMVLPIIAQQRARATYPELDAAIFDAPGMLEKISAPPGATETGFRNFDKGPKKRSFSNAGTAWATWSHSHDVAMSFDQVLAWYTPRLQADGWKVHEPASASGAAFCKAPWLLKITSAGMKPTDVGATTATRFELKLEWNNQFLEGSCQHP